VAFCPVVFYPYIRNLIPYFLFLVLFFNNKSSLFYTKFKRILNVFVNLFLYLRTKKSAFYSFYEIGRRLLDALQYAVGVYGTVIVCRLSVRNGCILANG